MLQSREVVLDVFAYARKKRPKAAATPARLTAREPAAPVLTGAVSEAEAAPVSTLLEAAVVAMVAMVVLPPAVGYGAKVVAGVVAL
jgi:hypothetical protein